jgi:uncharacterized surface protein with fasciclin (FAS1) repeats
MSFTKITVTSAVAALALGLAGAVGAQAAPQDPSLGAAPSSPSKTIVENLSNAPDETTLVALVKAAGLVATLQGPGPFTVFAPTNQAFTNLPQGTVNTMLQSNNNPQLIKILSYHVVSGRLSAADIIAQINAGGGSAVLTTTINEPLTATLVDGKVILTDVQGHKATVTIPDVDQSNGVIHVVDTVLFP